MFAVGDSTKFKRAMPLKNFSTGKPQPLLSAVFFNNILPFRDVQSLENARL